MVAVLVALVGGLGGVIVDGPGGVSAADGGLSFAKDVSTEQTTFLPSAREEQRNAKDGRRTALRLVGLDGRVLEVGLVEIEEHGTVRYLADGVQGEMALEDCLAIEPLAKKGSAAAGALPSALTIYLADGGMLRGVLLDQRAQDQRAGPSSAPAGGPHVLHVNISGGQVVRVAFEAAAGIRTAARRIAAVERVFQTQLTSRRPGRDVMIVARDGKAVVAPGSLEGLGPDGWTFRFGRRTRTGGLDRAYGFVLGAPLVRPKALPANVLLVSGDHFTARIVSADARQVRLDAGPLGAVALPWKMVKRIDLRSDRVVYLSDLTPQRTVQRTLLGTSWPAQLDKNVTGGPIRLGNRTYAKGLGVHAYTSISFKLDGEYERFSAMVGVDDSVGLSGSIVFRVKLDGRLLFDSSEWEQESQQKALKVPPARSESEGADGYLRGGGTPLAVSVDVRGGQLLTLECDVADALDLSDHGDWAGAMLIRARDGGGK